tara:strand:- start:2131 stop:2334 length:204 start_codon:yes stop_codon:yes gene_type:complete
MSEYTRISECGKYGRKANGELWANITSEYAYHAGYIMGDDEGAFYSGIDAHEEEMRIMMAELQGELE